MTNQSTVIDLKPLVSGYCQLTTNGLLLADNIPYSIWEQIGVALQQIDIAIQFAIGDWIAYGEHQYGEMYAQATHETGKNNGTLRNYVSVAKRVPLSRRNDNLSFSHHVIVAPLPGGEQTRYLNEAATNDWSTRQLQQYVRNGRTTTHTCPNCGHEW